MMMNQRRNATLLCRSYSATSRALNSGVSSHIAAAVRVLLPLLLLVLVSVVHHASALDNGVGLTPPMGVGGMS